MATQVQVRRYDSESISKGMPIVCESVTRIVNAALAEGATEFVFKWMDLKSSLANSQYISVIAHREKHETLVS